MNILKFIMSLFFFVFALCANTEARYSGDPPGNPIAISCWEQSPSIDMSYPMVYSINLYSNCTMVPVYISEQSTQASTFLYNNLEELKYYTPEDYPLKTYIARYTGKDNLDGSTGVDVTYPLKILLLRV